MSIQKFGVGTRDGEKAIENYNTFIKDVMLYRKGKFVYDEQTAVVYRYATEKGIYEAQSQEQVKHYLFTVFDSVLPNRWEKKEEDTYFPIFMKRVKRIKGMNLCKELIIFSNGILNLKSMEFRGFSEKAYSTIRIPFPYDPEAKCERFEQFLKEIACDNEKIVASLEELLGYVCDPQNKASKMFLLVGGGSNGKSVYLNILRKMVGGYNVMALPLSEFNKQFQRHALKDKLLNVIAEGEFKQTDTLLTPIVKSYITSDDVTAEIKGGVTYTYKPNLKIVVAVNQLPSKFTERSEAIVRRVLYLPFNNTFSGEKKDINLEDKLTNEMSGIINLAFRGLERLKKNKYVFSYDVDSRKQLNSLLERNNPVLEFVNTYISNTYGTKTSYAQIFDSFQKWCNESDIKAQYAQASFTVELKNILQEQNIPVIPYISNGVRGLVNIECNYKEKKLCVR